MSGLLSDACWTRGLRRRSVAQSKYGRPSEQCFMDELIKEKCTACRRDSPQVTDAEIAELRPQIPEWTLIEREGIPRLERGFRFRNFADAVAFTNRIAALAGREGHHPAILTDWGRVTVTLWTH